MLQGQFSRGVKENVEYLTEHKLKDDFVWNLASGSFSDPQQTVLQGLRLKFDLSLNYACIRFRAVLPDETAEYSRELVDRFF